MGLYVVQNSLTDTAKKIQIHFPGKDVSDTWELLPQRRMLRITKTELGGARQVPFKVKQIPGDIP